MWGPSDDDSWLNYFFTVRMDWPLLFDRQLQAKPAYWGIVDPTYLTASPLWARIVPP
jgi:endo-1,4-beta-xylanase